ITAIAATAKTETAIKAYFILSILKLPQGILYTCPDGGSYVRAIFLQYSQPALRICPFQFLLRMTSRILPLLRCSLRGLQTGSFQDCPGRRFFPLSNNNRRALRLQSLRTGLSLKT